MVMFEPVDYEVSEGETADVILVTNLAYSFNFSVIVACVNGSAFGMLVIFLLFIDIKVLLYYIILTLIISHTS